MTKALKVNPKEKDLPLSYTKHYYIGSERVSAKTGTMDKLGYYPLHWVTSEMSHLNIAVQDSSASRFVKAADVVTIIPGLLNALQPTLSYEDNYIDLYDATHDPEKMDIFYFHPDHLGSSSYITNMRGMVSQHMEYLPFGELLVDEHKNSYNSPFKYNGKEFDEETGNYFYGARYYDPKWSIFISVDPLAEQAPDWTPYRYGFNNPIRYTDPTGMFEEDDLDHDYKLLKNGKIELEKRTDDNFDRITTEDGSRSIVLNKSFMESFNNFFDRGYEFEIRDNNFRVYNKAIFYFFADNTDVEWLYNEFTNTQTGERFGTLITSINKGTVQGAFKYTTRTLDSNKDIHWDYNIHNHPSTESISDFYPSGWIKDTDGTIRKSTRGDRGFYNAFKTDPNYNNRMPDFFDVYAPKINKTLKYNNEKYFSTN